MNDLYHPHEHKTRSSRLHHLVIFFFVRNDVGVRISQCS